MSLLPVSAIDIGERYRHDMGDLAALAASIEAVGLLHPIVVMGRDGGNRWTLVAGERRLRACRDILRWERIHVRIVPESIDLLRAEHDENTVREPFTPSEAVAIAAALRREPVPDLPNLGSRRDRIASAVGMSHETLRKAEDVVEAAQANPVLAPLVDAMDDTGRVAPVHAALQALPPDPEPEHVEAAAQAVRERRKPDPMGPLTPAQAERFPQLVAAELSRDLSVAIASVRTDRLDPAKWVERLPQMRPEDLEDIRSKVAHVHRWADEWDALLAPRPLSIVGGSK
jgi:ParB/RepB/Spo0J family partition protein